MFRRKAHWRPYPASRTVLPLRRKVCETTVADVKEKRVTDLMSDENDVCHKTHGNRIFLHDRKYNNAKYKI